jgi:hypothetical protein
MTHGLEICQQTGPVPVTMAPQLMPRWNMTRLQSGLLYASPDCPLELQQDVIAATCLDLEAIERRSIGEGSFGRVCDNGASVVKIFKDDTERALDDAKFNASEGAGIDPNYYSSEYLTDPGDFDNLILNAALPRGLRAIKQRRFCDTDKVRISAPDIHAAFIPHDEYRDTVPTTWGMNKIAGHHPEEDEDCYKEVRIAACEMALKACGITMSGVELDDRPPNTLIQQSGGLTEVCKIDIQASEPLLFVETDF